MAQDGALKFQVVEGWEQLPEGYAHRDVAGVAVDGEDRVYLICRGDHPVIVYDRKGKLPALVGRRRVHLSHARHLRRPRTARSSAPTTATTPCASSRPRASCS